MDQAEAFATKQKFNNIVGLTLKSCFSLYLDLRNSNVTGQFLFDIDFYM